MSHLLHEESPLYGCCCFSSSLWATQRGGKFEISKRKTIHSVRGSRRCQKALKESKFSKKCQILIAGAQGSQQAPILVYL